MALSLPQNTQTFFLLRMGLLFMEEPSPAVLLKAMSLTSLNIYLAASFS
jgi:hypothetical protein